MRLSCQHLLFQKILHLCASLQMQLYLWGPPGLGLGSSEKSADYQWELCVTILVG